MSDLSIMQEIAKARAERLDLLRDDLDDLLGEAVYWLAQAHQHAEGRAVHGITVVDPHAREVAKRIAESKWAVEYARRRARELHVSTPTAAFTFGVCLGGALVDDGEYESPSDALARVMAEVQTDPGEPVQILVWSKRGAS